MCQSSCSDRSHDSSGDAGTAIHSWRLLGQARCTAASADPPGIVHLRRRPAEEPAAWAGRSAPGLACLPGARVDGVEFAGQISSRSFPPIAHVRPASTWKRSCRGRILPLSSLPRGGAGRRQAHAGSHHRALGPGANRPPPTMDEPMRHAPASRAPQCRQWAGRCLMISAPAWRRPGACHAPPPRTQRRCASARCCCRASTACKPLPTSCMPWIGWPRRPPTSSNGASAAPRASSPDPSR